MKNSSEVSNYTFTSSASQSGDSLYRDLAATFWRRKWSIVAIVFLSIIPAYVYLAE